MRTEIVLLAVIGVAIFCVGWSDGNLEAKSLNSRECYTCFYAEGNGITDRDLEKAKFGVFQGHKSCARNKKPEKKFLANCNSYIQYNTSCSKITQKGRIGNDEYRFTIRGCFSSEPYKNVTQTCGDRDWHNIQGLAATHDLQKAFHEITNFTKLLNAYPAPSGRMCNCDSDRCNSAFPSVSMISLVTLGSVLVLGYFVGSLATHKLR